MKTGLELNFCRTLTQSWRFERLHADNLLRHQMKAIDFIRQREDCDLPVSLSLWNEQKLAGEET